MGELTLINADVRKWGRDGRPFHAMLCDPPYEIDFMGKGWDGSGVAFEPATWERLLAALHPGAFAISFAGSQMQSWVGIANAILRAGFAPHPSLHLLSWVNACLSDDTEILTESGFVQHSSLSPGQQAMCYNVGDGTLEWMPIERVHRYAYSNTAYRIQSDHTDQIVTRNHRCLVERGGRYVFERADALMGQETVPILEAVPVVWTALLCGEPEGVLEETDVLEAVRRQEGAEEPRGRCAGISLRKAVRTVRRGNRNKKRPRVAKQALLREVWMSQGPHGISKKRGRNHLRCLREEKVRAKSVDTRYEGTNLLEKVRWCFAREGTRKTRAQGPSGLACVGGGVVSRKDDWPEQPRMEGRDHAGQPQGCLRNAQGKVHQVPERVPVNGTARRLRGGTPYRCGYAGGTPTNERGDRSPYQSRPGGQPPREPNGVPEQLSPQEVRGAWRTGSTVATITPIRYVGTVWCVTVPTGAFVARRNGMVFITGNSGWPKGVNVSKAIDAEAGAEREVVGIERSGRTAGLQNLGESGIVGGEFAVTAPATPLAKTWDGYRYGVQSLRPCAEPALVFQRPYEGRPLDCITTTGAGALNIEAGRIATGDNLNGGRYSEGFRNAALLGDAGGTWAHGEYKPHKEFEQPAGRFPSNVMIIHLPECRRVGTKRVKGDKHSGKPGNGQDGQCYARGIEFTGDTTCYADADGLEEVEEWECAPGCPAALLGAQSGKAGGGTGKPIHAGDFGKHGRYGKANGATTQSFADEGDASRFYHNAGWEHEVAEQMAGAVPWQYEGKASTTEREAGLVGIFPCVRCGDKNSITHIERNEQTGKEYEVVCRRNQHVTVKPIGLTRHLAALLLPPQEYAPRRILIPFAGVGSEAIGALLAGWDEIVCIEQDPDYCRILEARFAWWRMNPTGAAPRAAAKRARAAGSAVGDLLDW